MASTNNVSGLANSLDTQVKNVAGYDRSVDFKDTSKRTDHPGHYDATSADDEVRLAKVAAVAGKDSGASPFGVVQASDRDFEWLREKKKAQEAIAFDQWFSGLFDTKDPAVLQLTASIYPEFYQRKEQQIEMEMELLKRLKMLRVRGVRSQQDLQLLWAIQTGRLRIPDLDKKLNSVFEPVGGIDKDDGYQRGLFNFKKQIAKAPAVVGANGQVGSIFPGGADVAAPGIDQINTSLMGQAKTGTAWTDKIGFKIF